MQNQCSDQLEFLPHRGRVAVWLELYSRQGRLVGISLTHIPDLSPSSESYRLGPATSSESRHPSASPSVAIVGSYFHSMSELRPHVSCRWELVPPALPGSQCSLSEASSRWNRGSPCRRRRWRAVPPDRPRFPNNPKLPMLTWFNLSHDRLRPVYRGAPGATILMQSYDRPDRPVLA